MQEGGQHEWTVPIVLDTTYIVGRKPKSMTTQN